MIELLRHWTILLTGMTFTGLLGAFAASHAQTPRGALGPTIFHAESPLVACLATAAALAGSLLAAIVVGRFLNTVVGLFVLGWGLGVMTMRTESVQEFAFAGSPSQVLIAIEVLCWAGVLFGLTWMMFRFSGMLSDVFPDEHEETPNPFNSRAAIKSALAGVLVLPVVAVIAQSTMKGQVLTSVFLGATAAGLAARLIAPHVQPMLIFATPCLLGAIGHGWGMYSLSNANLTLSEAAVQHVLPALSLPMPLDYAAGTMMGVAFGLGWARSFLHHEETEEHTAPTTAEG